MLIIYLEWNIFKISSSSASDLPHFEYEGKTWEKPPEHKTEIRSDGTKGIKWGPMWIKTVFIKDPTEEHYKAAHSITENEWLHIEKAVNETLAIAMQVKKCLYVNIEPTNTNPCFVLYS